VHIGDQRAGASRGEEIAARAAAGHRFGNPNGPKHTGALVLFGDFGQFLEEIAPLSQAVDDIAVGSISGGHRPGRKMVSAPDPTYRLPATHAGTKSPGKKHVFRGGVGDIGETRTESPLTARRERSIWIRDLGRL